MSRAAERAGASDADIDAARAYGPRLSYADLPAPVHALVEETLGAPVIEATTQVGGFSPGTAARVRGANGRRAFVKSAGLPLNPHTPGLLRDEIAVLTDLGSSPLRPDLLASYDDQEWVALVLEDLAGTTPRLPWQPSDLTRVLAALDELAATHTPTPRPDAPTLVTRIGPWFDCWAILAADRPPDLDPWVRRHLEGLVDLAADGLAAIEAIDDVEPSDTCVHLDVRSDNILLLPDRVVFVDWNWSCTGPDWIDTATLALEVRVVGSAGGLDADRLLATAARTRDLPPELLTGFYAGIVGMAEERSRAPAPPGLPRIRPFQAAYAAAGRAWLAERLDWA